MGATWAARSLDGQTWFTMAVCSQRGRGVAGSPGSGGGHTLSPLAASTSCSLALTCLIFMSNPSSHAGQGPSSAFSEFLKISLKCLSDVYIARYVKSAFHASFSFDLIQPLQNPCQAVTLPA